MRLSLHPYRLPLAEPLVLKGVRHAERAGVLVRLDDGQRVGWGDAAPLPGFSAETLGEATAQLGDAASLVAGLRPGPAWLDPESEVHAALDGLLPSARFALDLALCDLAAQAAGRTLAQALHPDPAVTLPLNALLAGEPEAVLAEAEQRVREGYRTLKLKVGRRDPEAEAVLVRALRQRVGPSVALRADANQAWTLPEAAAFAEGARSAQLEYVEEPLREPEALPLLWFDTGLPVALDESLAGMEPEALQGWAAAVVLKPTLLGGVARTLRFARQAQALGIRPVLSGAFESGVAMRGHVALAAATGASAAGLDPYRRLAADVLAPRLALDRPTVDVPAFFREEPQIVLPEAQEG